MTPTAAALLLAGTFAGNLGMVLWVITRPGE
jgi:hypothetical protein